jgi:2-polyprenyl-3-methyl-5-hydroxy-6-metoxy-1,4-benzoquinol methylase
MLCVLKQLRGSWRWRLAQALEIRWWKKYLNPQAPAAYLAWKRAYWLGFLEKIQCPLPQGKHILDAGCGPAGIFTILEKNNRVEALDPLLEQYERHLSHFSQAHYPGVRFWSQPLETFCAERPFDHVFCLNAINHVADLQLCLNNLAQCTAPNGGVLVLSIDAHRWSVLKWIFRWLPGDALHPHQHSLADYEQLLDSAGLSVQHRFRLQNELIFGYWALVCTRKG